MSESNGDRLVFDDLAPREFSVSIGGKAYVLKEATGDAACKWRNSLLKQTRMADGKVTGVGDMADAEPLLVALCLFEKTDKGDLPVSLHTVRGWPGRVVKALFEKAKEISDLAEQDKEDADPPMIDLCRRDLALDHHPDRGGSAERMAGINTALDWLKDRVRAKEAAKDRAKNLPSGSTAGSS